MKAIHPAQGWLLCRIEAAPEVTEGGIIMPATVVDRELEGDGELPPVFTVLALPTEESPGVQQEDVTLQYPEVGDSILVQAKAGAFLRFGKGMFMVRVDSVMAVVTSGDEN